MKLNLSCFANYFGRFARKMQSGDEDEAKSHQMAFIGRSKRKRAGRRNAELNMRYMTWRVLFQSLLGRLLSTFLIDWYRLPPPLCLI